MKLATFTIADGGDEIGAVEGDRIVSLTRAMPQLPRDMKALIANWPALEADIHRAARDAAHKFALEDAHVRAPIARPGKIMAIGLNYADHIAESNLGKPEHQVWFAKMPSAVNPPYDPILIGKEGPMVDYEAELVAVIGAGGKHIARDAASMAVFGYCCGNDVSERGWQHRTAQWVLGKSFDTHAPFGPWITTADEVGDPHALAIRSFVNGEKRQDSNTRNLVFNVWDQVAHLSQAMTLEPGDLIFTGTPGGVGAAMKPPRFLKPGDIVRVEIDKLGHIEARCVGEE